MQTHSYGPRSCDPEAHLPLPGGGCMKDPDRSTVRCSALTFGRALVGAALLSLVSGCTPGQVAPSPYGCGDVTSGHCYAQFQPALGGRDPASTQCTADPG